MSDKQPTRPAAQAKHQGPTHPHPHPAPHPHPEPDLQIDLAEDTPQDACEMHPMTFNGRDPRAHAAWHKRFQERLKAKNPTG